MNPHLVMVVGLLGMGALFLWLNSTLDDKKHWIMRLLIVFLFFSLMLLVPRVAVDAYTQCEIVLNNTVTTGAIVDYDYNMYCQPYPNHSADTFWIIVSRFYWIFVGYVVVFLGIWGLMKVIESVKKGGGRGML